MTKEQAQSKYDLESGRALKMFQSDEITFAEWSKLQNAAVQEFWKAILDADNEKNS